MARVGLKLLAGGGFVHRLGALGCHRVNWYRPGPPASLFGVSQPVALSPGLDDLAAVGESVQDGPGHWPVPRGRRRSPPPRQRGARRRRLRAGRTSSRTLHSASGEVGAGRRPPIAAGSELSPTPAAAAHQSSSGRSACLLGARLPRVPGRSLR